MSKIWNYYRIKDIAKVSRGASPRPIQNYLTDDEVNGIPWIKISDATKVKKYIESTEEYIIPSGAGKSNLVLPGDLIVSNSATPGIPRFLKIKACIHDGWLLLRKLKNVKKEFLFYLIESIRSKLKNQGTGSIFINLSIDILANEVVFIPTLEEQTKIANYLDAETSKIDRKISILEQKYEKLEEYKQSVIFETVTKGLDNNVAMKDSGIDWIGNIPDHWEVKRVKDIALCYAGGTPDTRKEEYWNNGQNYWAASGNLKNGFINLSILKKITDEAIENSSTKKIIPYTTLLAMTGATCGEVGYSNELIYANQSVCAIKNNKKITHFKYLFYSLMIFRKAVEDMKSGGAQGGITVSDIKFFKILVPDYQEQEKIVIFLDKICLKIDKKKEIIKKQIELLKEYKQTIIYEAVTGKIEIGELYA